MSVRIKGAKSAAYPAPVVLQRAIDLRLRDKKYRIPLQLVYLDWNPDRKNYHQSKTKGDFEDLFIIRKQKGLEVEYRSPGCLEWLQDGLSGQFSAMCPITEKNMLMLASLYYEGMFTIRDRSIDDAVKKAADAIEEQNKKIPYTFIRVKRELDTKTGFYVNVEETVEATVYDFHLYRRKLNSAGAMDQNKLPSLGVKSGNALLREQDVESERRSLKERERIIREKEKELGITTNVLPTKSAEVPAPEFTEESLRAMHMGKLRKTARDHFGITDAFAKNKDQIIPEIIAQLNGGDQPEPVVIPDGKDTMVPEPEETGQEDLLKALSDNDDMGVETEKAVVN